MPVIADGLSHRFGNGPLLFHDLAFTLVPGRRYAVTGPFGSGTPTLLSILSGWLKPTCGSITRTEIETTAWVFPNPHGVAHRTALELVALPLLAQGHDRRTAREEADRRLAQVGLEHIGRSRFSDLSGGEAQRLMLARGMATSPDLLLVVEPTARLDRGSSAAINNVLATLAQPETIIVVATHDRGTRDACTDAIDLGPVPHAVGRA